MGEVLFVAFIVNAFKIFYIIVCIIYFITSEFATSNMRTGYKTDSIPTISVWPLRAAVVVMNHSHAHPQHTKDVIHLI